HRERPVGRGDARQRDRDERGGERGRRRRARGGGQQRGGGGRRRRGHGRGHEVHPGAAAEAARPGRRGGRRGMSLTRARPRERRVALLVVVWVLMLRAALARDFAQHIRDAAMAALTSPDETQGYSVAFAGLNRPLYEIAQPKAANPAGAANAAVNA